MPRVVVVVVVVVVVFMLLNLLPKTFLVPVGAGAEADSLRSPAVVSGADRDAKV
jgi:hypothetical protein